MKKKATKYCCEEFQYYYEMECPTHGKDAFECPDIMIGKLGKNGEYVLPVRDGGLSGIIINFCPWCGKSLYSKGKKLDVGRVLDLAGWDEKQKAKK